MPVFLLALPGGAMADIVDRRIFLIGTQVWTVLAAGLLAALTLTGGMTAGWLLILTFAIGIGSALTAPAWSAIIPELVPREDLVAAITLNGIGYNLTRAIGPALAGFLILLGGSGLTFSLYTVSILSVIGALIMWRRRPPLHRPAAGASVFRHAGGHAVRAQHARDPARDDPHHLLFHPRLGAMGLAAVVCAARPVPRPGHVRVHSGDDGGRRRHLRHAAADGARQAEPGCHGGGLQLFSCSGMAIVGLADDWGWRRSGCCCSGSAGPRPTRRSRRRRNWCARPGCGRARWRSISWRRTVR